jgi:hypothetical protein
MPFDYKIKPDSTALMTCCNEIQFVYVCAYCYEEMGCMYCTDFDMKDRHDCSQD